MKVSGCLLLLLLTLCGLSFGQDRGIDGVWQGALEAGGTRLRLVIKITRTSAGGYDGVIDSIDQGTTIRIDSIAIIGDDVRMEVKAIGGSYDGNLNKDRTEMTGKWSQGGGSLPLTLKIGTQPGSTKSPAPAPAEAKPATT